MGEAAGGWGRVEGLPHPASMRRRTVARGRPDAFTKPSIVRARRSDLWAGGRVANMRLAWGGCDRTRQNAKERNKDWHPQTGRSVQQSSHGTFAVRNRQLIRIGTGAGVRNV